MMGRITHYFYDAIGVNGYLWLLEANMNALFKMNMKTFKLEFVSLFPNESTVSWLYKFAAGYGNKLVCCPRNAKSLVIYDMDSDSMETIAVDFDKYKKSGAGMYGDGVVGHKIYLPRQGYSKIYQLDIASGELSVLNIFGGEMELGMDEYFWHDRIRQYKKDTEIILLNLKYNAFYQYNILTSEAKKIECFGEKDKLVDFVSDGYFIWGLCSNGRIYKSDGNQIIDEYLYDTTGTDSAELLYYKNRIYMVDAVTGKIISSIETGRDNGEDILKKIPDNRTRLFSISFSGEDHVWMQWEDGSFYYRDGINEMSGIIEGDLDNIPKAAFLTKEIVKENTGISLQRLLKIVKYQPDVFRGASGETGTHIYNAI